MGAKPPTFDSEIRDLEKDKRELRAVASQIENNEPNTGGSTFSMDELREFKRQMGIYGENLLGRSEPIDKSELLSIISGKIDTLQERINSTHENKETLRRLLEIDSNTNLEAFCSTKIPNFVDTMYRTPATRRLHQLNGTLKARGSKVTLSDIKKTLRKMLET